jgi:DNA polymerase (family 10)
MNIAEAASQRIYWAAADEIVQVLREHLEGCSAVEELEFAGSYRRGKETVGDLDALVVSTDHNQVMDCFGEFEGVSETLVRGDTKMSVRLVSGLQIDLRVVPQESFGAALQYFTGSKEHNVVLRGLAKQQGLKINEYGVFRVQDDQQEYIAGETEADVYAALGLPVIAPELRENRHEFAWARENELPPLLEISDIAGDLHMHTTETDGLATLDEMIAAARDRGLQYIAITDHSQRVSMAGGLDPKRLLKQWAEIDELNRVSEDEFLVLKGIEVDILEKGGLDLPDDVLAQGDWIVASVHYGQRQSRQQITERILEALENPHVCVIAHPTGRLLNRREPYEVDIDAVLHAARKHGKMLELNAHPSRLDLDDVHCAAAKELGVPVVISTDAHNTEGLDVMRYGVLQARRGGLTAADVANTQPWKVVRARIGKAP